jgi:hypothetical protein
LSTASVPPEHLINHKEHDMSEKKPPAATPQRPTPSPGRQKKGKAGGYVPPPPPKPMTPSKKGR